MDKGTITTEMTLRDWFAGQIASAVFTDRSISGLLTATDDKLSEAAEFCYRVADALMAAADSKKG